MSLDFTAIPIRDPYKVAHPESVVLLADPNTIRLCVVVEVIVVVVVFVLSGYYTAITGSNETKITFEIIDGYDCSILAPRKDIEELVVSKSELIAFSSPRYTYDECIVALDTQGYDLCSDDHRQDYELSITGIDVGDDNCEEIFLTDGYRFCYNQEKITAVDAVEFNGIFAGSNEDNNYAWIMKDSAYFFSKGVGDFHQVTPTFDTQVANPMDSIFGSDFAPDDSSASLYVVATRFTEQFGLYKMSTDNSTSQLIASLQIPPTGAHGIAFGSKSAFVYYISELSHQGTIVKYNTTSKTISENAAVNCSQYITTGSSLGGGYGYRYLSYGSDGMLYAMCTTSTKAVRYSSPPASPPAYVFPVIQVDPHTLTTIKVIYAMINSIVDSNTGSGIDAVSQALQVGTGREMIFLGSSPSKTVIQGDLDDGLSSSGGKILTLQNIAQKGSYQGTYAVVPSNDVLYFAPKTYKTYIVSSGTFSTYPTNFLGQHYTATRVQFGFTYQICDGAYTNYTVDSSVSTSFYKQCQSSDG